jgi:hypothetical protein
VADAKRFSLVGENTLRLFKVAYPLLRVKANLHTMTDNRNFHLIQQYMLNMVSGQASSLPPAPKGQSLVQNKDELLKLMGLNYGFWDVASLFYEDLVMGGDIVETDLGLFAKEQMPVNAKRLRAPSPRYIPSPLVVDPFDCRICQKSLLASRPKDGGNVAKSNQSRICMIPFPSYLLDPNMLERQINDANFNFAAAAEHSLTQQLMDQGLPGDIQGISLCGEEEEPIEILYLTCYLTLEQTPEGISFRLYHAGNGQPVHQLPIGDREHGLFRKTVLGLADCSQELELYTKLSNSVNLQLREKGGVLCNGVTQDENGNYRYRPSTDTLRQLLTVEEPAARESLDLMLEGYPLVITDFEAGRLVYTDLAPEHRQLCLDVLAGADLQQALHRLTQEEVLPGQ